MLTTNGSLATADTVTGVGTERTIPPTVHEGVESYDKVEASSIVCPSMDQLDDFFELLPLLRSADICVFTEAGVCRLSHMADPFEATNDLIDRGVKGIVILRPHSIVVANGSMVEEMRVPAYVNPCEHVREFSVALKACEKSHHPLYESFVEVSRTIFAHAVRDVEARNCNSTKSVFSYIVRMLGR